MARPTIRHRVSAFGALSLAASLSLSLSTVGIAHAATPTDRAGFVVGRFSDSSDFGDFSTPLTQSLAILALHRTAGTAPSDAAISLLLAQQCDDGGFSGSFRAPSTEGPSACVPSVDTTGYAVQALAAVGQGAAVSAAAGWLADVQAADGSFASADGTNTNSTGLAAIALRLGGADEAADAAVAWVLGEQDGCDATEPADPGAIPFSQNDRGFVELATAQALPGLVGISLAEVSASGAAGEPSVTCSLEPDVFDDGQISAAAAWLVASLNDDQAVTFGGFESPGTTADALFALAAVGVAPDTITGMADWLEGQRPGYTQGSGFDAADAAYAGASAKLLLALEVAGRNPRNVGGVDLVAQLEGREVSAPAGVEVTCDVPDSGVVPGSEVTCQLSSLLVGETVRVLVTVNPTLFDGAVTADTGGDASFTFEVPDDLADGDEIVITVDGLGAAGIADLSLTVTAAPITDGPDGEEPSTGTPGPDDPDGQPVDPVIEVVVVADELPATGLAAVPAGLLAGALLASGAALLRSTRRRNVAA